MYQGYTSSSKRLFPKEHQYHLRTYLKWKFWGNTPTEPEIQAVGLSNLCSSKQSKWLWFMPKFGNHYSTSFGIKIPLQLIKSWIFSQRSAHLNKCTTLHIFQKQTQNRGIVVVQYSQVNYIYWALRPFTYNK